MNKGRIQAMIEEQTEHERHQFLAGAQRVIIATDKSLKRVAKTQRKKELGEQEDEQ